MPAPSMWLFTGKGVFVSPDRGVTPAKARHKAIGEMARRLLAEAKRIGAGKDEVLRIIEAEADKMESNE